MKGRNFKYEMMIRGGTYGIDGYGRIEGHKHWKVYGVALRWNGQPILWKDLKKQLDKGRVITGYLYDIDCGTIRFWGGSYFGKLPKVTIYKRSAVY